MCSEDNGRSLLQCGLKSLLENNLVSTEKENLPLATLGEPLTDDRRSTALHCVEIEVLRILRQLVNGEVMELSVPKVTKWDRNLAPVTAPDSECAVSRVRYDVPASRHKFTVIVLLLSRVHRQLNERASGTRRRMYYEDVTFLKSQREVDDAALSVSRVLRLPPWHLGLLATAKGLVAGDLTITTADGEVLDCSNKPGGVLIPGDVCAVQSVRSSARFILVLEKDTVFQRVLQEGILDRLGPCIVITGKGYPDVSTRALLSRLEAELRLPMLAVMDADPHGVHIMCVYRFGTRTCPLALPSLRWLGVLPSELSSLGLRSAPLTPKDLVLTRALLDKKCLSDAHGIRAEIETFLTVRQKGEVDALLDISPCYITDVYLPNKIAAAHVL
ncbi:meiotic recombination protein W68 [Frankliniella occidentalis]|uniref:DNA topoisomerase (ATP-hydrolyzing) n=1 Tax=Frankliniella occidentalis TaxID=133901 RepID=A0A9C6XA79_FRAOC|nr:meiotic recombination protein W68 [Frankliniella occidentalis]